MSTRCAIGYQDKNGKIKGIYCHSDGYPDGVGKTLRDHYTDTKKIKKLLSMGNVSVLDENIGEKISFEDFETRKIMKQCSFYKRDRGDKDEEAKSFNTTQEFMNYFDEEYHYLFVEKDRKWALLEKQITIIQRDITWAINNIK